MDRVCDEEIWVNILIRNFSDFLNRLRDKLKDDLEFYFYLTYRFHSFFLIIFLCILFLCILLCVKEDVTKRNLMNAFVIFVPELLYKSSMNNMILMIL